MCLLCNSSSLVIANIGVKSGDKHERLIHELGNALTVGLNTNNAILVERIASISQKVDGVQDIADDQGLENIELEVTTGASNSHSDLVAHNLSTDHGKSFALSRVDLARHDGAARLVLRKGELSETASRTRSEEANIISNLEKRSSNSVEGTVKKDKSVLSSKRFELVRCGLEFEASFLSEILSNLLGEPNIGVQASSDSSSTLSDFVDIFKSHFNAL